jgi:hypothetical protein
MGINGSAYRATFSGFSCQQGGRMTHPPLDLVRLGKILALTTSPSDGEALAAARKAASLVQRAGLDYGRLLSGHLPGQTGGAVGASPEAERELRQLRAEVAALRQQARGARPQLASEHLRRQLLAKAPLHSWERAALDDIAAVRPNTREEYYVLWLARRYRMGP